MKSLLSLVLLVACVTPSGSQQSAADPKVVSARDARLLLSVLRDRRDEVVHAGPDQRVDRGSALDVSPLVGLAREEIASVLGDPQSCGTESPVKGRCSTDVWEYAMYHLPQESIGGGTVLLLGFDAGGTCNLAAWSGRK